MINYDHSFITLFWFVFCGIRLFVFHHEQISYKDQPATVISPDLSRFHTCLYLKSPQCLSCHSHKLQETREADTSIASGSTQALLLTTYVFTGFSILTCWNTKGAQPGDFSCILYIKNQRDLDICKKKNPSFMMHTYFHVTYIVSPNRKQILLRVFYGYKVSQPLL